MEKEGFVVGELFNIFERFLLRKDWLLINFYLLLSDGFLIKKRLAYLLSQELLILIVRIKCLINKLPDTVQFKRCYEKAYTS